MIVSAILPCMIVATVFSVLLLRARSRLGRCRRCLAGVERGRSAALLAAQEAATAAARLREMLDALPLPVWRRDRVITDCNRAYAEALGSTRERVLAEARELSPRPGHGGVVAIGAAAADEARPAGADDAASAELSGRPASQTHVVIGGQRRLLELVECRCASPDHS